MNTDHFIKQLDNVITEAEALLNRFKIGGSGTVEEMTLILSKAKSAVTRISGADSDFYKDVNKAYSSHWQDTLERILGPIKALKSDIENGYLKSAHQIIQSEVFSDYLEMAEYLQGEGYKDAAAVIAGSTLEAHLKETAKDNTIELHIKKANGDLIPKKASVLNDELAKASIYSSSYQKQITAWLGVRNDAAHGDYNKYTSEQVTMMIQGIRQFTLR